MRLRQMRPLLTALGGLTAIRFVTSTAIPAKSNGTYYGFDRQDGSLLPSGNAGSALLSTSSTHATPDSTHIRIDRRADSGASHGQSQHPQVQSGAQDQAQPQAEAQAQTEPHAHGQDPQIQSSAQAQAQAQTQSQTLTPLQVWQTAQSFGDDNLRLTDIAGFSNPPVRVFTKYTDITKQGWKRAELRPEAMDIVMEGFENIKKDLSKIWPQGIGMSHIISGENDVKFGAPVFELVCWEQRFPTGTNQRTRRCSFLDAYDIRDGIIVSGANRPLNPQNVLALGDSAQNAMLDWSDLAFLEWQHQIEVQKRVHAWGPKAQQPVVVDDLNYIVRLSTNSMTRRVLFEAARRWPGCIGPGGAVRLPTYSNRIKAAHGQTELYRALMGTHEAGQVVRLLNWHAGALGRMYVSNIWAFVEAEFNDRREPGAQNLEPVLIFKLMKEGASDDVNDEDLMSRRSLNHRRSASRQITPHTDLAGDSDNNVIKSYHSKSEVQNEGFTHSVQPAHPVARAPLTVEDRGLFDDREASEHTNSISIPSRAASEPKIQPQSVHSTTVEGTIQHGRSLTDSQSLDTGADRPKDSNTSINTIIHRLELLGLRKRNDARDAVIQRRADNDDEYDDPGETSDDSNISISPPPVSASEGGSSSGSDNLIAVDTQATQQQMLAAITHGQQLLSWISMSIPEATNSLRQMNKLPPGQPSSESPFTDYSEIEANEWVPGHVMSDRQEIFDFSLTTNIAPVEEALNGLNLPVDVGRFEDQEAENRLKAWVLKAHVPQDSPHQYRAADGEYVNAYNTAGGVIIACYNHHPRLGFNGGPVPDLNHWSDIVFLDYQHQAQQDNQAMANLRYIIQMKAERPETREFVLAAMQKLPPESLPDWDHRVIFEASSNEFKAILSTPNGVGVAWLLINHKHVWPRKTISRVIIYCDSMSLREPAEKQYPTLIFELEDLPAPPIRGGRGKAITGPSSGNRKGGGGQSGGSGSTGGSRKRPASGSFEPSGRQMGSMAGGPAGAAE